MSSYMSAAQIEAQRKAKLKKDLTESVQQLKEQLRASHENLAQVEAGTHIRLMYAASDDSDSGYDKNIQITEEMVQSADRTEAEKREELDFSALLYAEHKKTDRLSRELAFWLGRVEERPILTKKDEQDRTRILAELARLVRDTSMDREDQVKAVKMRVSGYLQGASVLSAAEEARIRDQYLEYCALCEMLECIPTEQVPYRVEQEVKRMTGLLEKRQQEAYVMEVIGGILEELGCHAEEEAVLDHTAGRMYSVEGNSLCDVFVGRDGSGILFEPVGRSREGSLERQRQTLNSANAICSLYPLLEERAADRGVILQRIYAEPVELEELFVQSDVSVKTDEKRKRKTAVQKQRTLNSEE